MSAGIPSSFDLEKKNAELEQATPEEIIAFAHQTWGRDLVMQSSFGADSACLLHLATSVVPDIRVLFLQTHYHFRETIDFKKHLMDRLHLNVVDLEVLKGREAFLEEHGDDLHHRDHDHCCFLNKVEPMETAKIDLGVKAYLTGVRRQQSDTREAMPILMREPTGIIKISPIANWTKQRVKDHIAEYALPFHPLVKEGYPSIGCAPCTVIPTDPNDERSGRWTGKAKTECGLHLPMPPKNQDPVI